MPKRNNAPRRRPTPSKIPEPVFDDTLFPDAFPVDNPDLDDSPVRRGEYTLMTALDEVIQKSRRCGFSRKFWEDSATLLSHLTGHLGLTPMQCLVVGVLAENSVSMSWRDLGRFFNVTRLHMMGYSEEVEDLVDKGWIEPKEAREEEGLYEGFRLCHGVVTAMRKNEVFKPECLSGLSVQDLIDRMCERMDVGGFGFGNDYQAIRDWCLRVVRRNPELHLCVRAAAIESPDDRFLFLNFVCDYAMWDGSGQEGLDMERIDHLFPPDHRVGYMRRALERGSHVLQTAGIIEPRCVNGIADPNSFVLSKDFCDEVLSDYKPNHRRCKTPKTTDRLLASHKEIKEKTLFFNASEQEQIGRLRDLLKGDRLADVRRRLEEQGMRRGVACIFHGGPGTGKTEAVLQLARASERDVMRVDVAALKDKWVGESEKNVRGIFRRYRDLCRNMERTPILFFNEADAIFSRRLEKVERSVDQMSNAIQNIILEEMEGLDGILIATTNLAGNLDKAFERRFLFKVRFENPSPEVKAKIWRSMLGDSFSDVEIRGLAGKYDFSGGQIENVVRKQSIDYVLSGEHPSYSDLLRYCDQERLASSLPRIGF